MEISRSKVKVIEIAFKIIIPWGRKIFFIYILIISSIIGLIINRIIILWVLIEINLLVFIPIISLEKNFRILGIKYFLIQVLGSIFLLVSILFLILFNYSTLINFFLLIRILWKRGTPPFQFWFFHLIINLDWINFFILSRWQKILPFYFLSLINFIFWELIIITILIVVIFGSYLQSRVKKILVYSSIFTSAWIFSSIIYFFYIWIFLLSIYRFLIYSIIIFLYVEKINIKENLNFFKISQINKILNLILFLRIIGIPPLTGFLIKIIVLIILIINNLFLLRIILIFCSIFIIYIYILIFLSALVFRFPRNKFIVNIINYNSLIYILILTILGNLSFLRLI